MTSFAQIALAALLGLSGISAAQAASTCTVQYAQRSEPSTDDSIGICLDKMLWLSVIDGSSRKLVTEISYVTKSNESNCNIDEARRLEAIEILKQQAHALKAQGACDQVEFLL